MLVAFTFTYPLTMRVSWAPQDGFTTSFLLFSLFYTALGDLVNSRPVHSQMLVFPPHLLSALSSSPFHCALQDGFGQTWWTGDLSKPLQFAPLYDGPVAYWLVACRAKNLFTYHMLWILLHEISGFPAGAKHWIVGIKYWIIIITIYPVTVRVVGAPQMISQPVSSILSCSPLPSGTWWTPGLSIPWCCLPTTSSVCLVFFPLSLCLARWF